MQKKFAIDIHESSAVNDTPEDREKYEDAMDCGWTIYRCSDTHIEDGTAIKVIRKVLELPEETD